jgi:hypothetical protein
MSNQAAPTAASTGDPKNQTDSASDEEEAGTDVGQGELVTRKEWATLMDKLRVLESTHHEALTNLDDRTSYLESTVSNIREYLGNSWSHFTSAAQSVLDSCADTMQQLKQSTSVSTGIKTAAGLCGAMLVGGAVATALSASYFTQEGIKMCSDPGNPWWKLVSATEGARVAVPSVAASVAGVT